MIEIIGGKLYVVDYWMPKPRQHGGIVRIAKPENWWVKTAYDASLVVSSGNYTHWIFTRATTAKGDIRWKFEGSEKEFGAVVDFLMKDFHERMGWIDESST